MEYKSKNNSCLECIWYDKCESKESCDFFDSGRLYVDEEIAAADEIAKIEYRRAYNKYTSEYEGGRNEQ